LLKLINASDVPGTAAEMAILLESLGYRIDDMKTDIERMQERTAIVFDEGALEEAVKISGQLGNVLISARTSPERESSGEHRPEIVIIVGKDRVK